MVNETGNRNRILERCKFRFWLVHWIDPRSIEHNYACFKNYKAITSQLQRSGVYPAAKTMTSMEVGHLVFLTSVKEFLPSRHGSTPALHDHLEKPGEQWRQTCQSPAVNKWLCPTLGLRSRQHPLDRQIDKWKPHARYQPLVSCEGYALVIERHWKKLSSKVNY